MPFARKFFTADLHLGHRGILKHCPETRPFDTVEAMDAAIVAGMKDRVGRDDILYIVGDFAIHSDPDYVRHLFHEIRGRKILSWAIMTSTERAASPARLGICRGISRRRPRWRRPMKAAVSISITTHAGRGQRHTAAATTFTVTCMAICRPSDARATSASTARTPISHR